MIIRSGHKLAYFRGIGVFVGVGVYGFVFWVWETFRFLTLW